MTNSSGIGALCAVMAAVLLIGCEQPRAPAATDSVSDARQARDRELCRAQVDDYMRNRRNVDESRRDIYRGDEERMGRSQLPEQMAAYGDTRSYDQLMSRCLEQRGWAQPRQEWWQRIGQPHAI